jgi:hypothetical protein
MIALTTKGNELIALINRSTSRSALNNRTWLFGDGTLQTTDQAAPYFSQTNYVNAGMVQSLGKLIWAGSSFVSGNTTALMLARLGTDILALVPLPQKVFIHGGLNDVIGSVAYATTMANMTSIVSQMQTAGIQPILGGMCPSDTTGYHAGISKLNMGYRAIAENAGIIFIDNHKLVSQTDGTWISGYANSGLFPANPGSVVLGAGVATAINASGGTLSWLPWQPTTQGNMTDGNGINLVRNACFAGSFSGTTPQYWTALDNTASSTTASITAATDTLVGSWWEIVKTDATSAHLNTWYQDVALGANLAVGDKVTFSVRVNMTEAAPSSVTPRGASVEAVFTGATTARTIGLTEWPRTAAGLFYGETTVPLGTTSVRILITFGNGTGTLKIGQVGLANMTALGL